MGKHKKEEKDEEDQCTEVSQANCILNHSYYYIIIQSSVNADNTPSYEDLVKLIGPIALPLASKKLTKRLLKVIIEL